MHFPGGLGRRQGAGGLHGTGIGWRRASLRRLASGLLVLGLLVLAAPFAASPALAQTLSVGINSNGTGDATGVEGESLTFTVKISATRSSNVTLKWRFVAGTARSADYSRDGDGNLTISAGSTSTTFSVDIVDDSRHENAETFEVEIYDASGATISRSKARVAIGIDSDNPDLPQFRIDDTAITVDEGAGPAAIAVRHGGHPSDVADITIAYTLVGITATAGDDFDATGGTLTFRKGRLETKTARIAVVDDGYVEDAETRRVADTLRGLSPTRPEIRTTPAQPPLRRMPPRGESRCGNRSIEERTSG